MSAPRVVLVYARNTPYDFEAQTPLSILALGTYLETHGVAVDYFDERVEPPAKFAALLAAGPDVVGFSVLGGYHIASSLRLSAQVRRESPGSFIVWGGVTPTTLPKETAAEDLVDCVVLGEGEESLLELVRARSEGRPLSGVRGLAFRDGAGVALTPHRPPPDLESLPFPYQGKAEAMLAVYKAQHKVREAVGYEGSRGCPFLCTFCYSPGFHDQTRVKSPAKVAAELDRLRALGVSDIDVYDDTLMGGRRGAIADLAARLRERGFTWIANLRINLLDAALLRALEDSGLRWMYFGIESDDDAALRRMQKGFTAEQIRRGVELLKGSRVPAVYSLLYGLPGDAGTGDERRVLDFAERLYRGHPGCEVQVQSYVPLPGSALYREAVAAGFQPPERLAGWIGHDHFKVSSPWLRDPGLPRKLYLSTFLAYRYRRHLSQLPLRLAAWPLHQLSLWRLRARYFGLYFERWLYEAYLAWSRLRTDLHYAR